MLAEAGAQVEIMTPDRSFAPEVMAMGGALGQNLSAAGVDDDAVLEPMSAPQVSSAAGDQASALSALINLGYGQGDAAGAVAQASGEGALGEGALIRAALKLLAPKG